MNILVIGLPSENITAEILKSRLLDKIYTAGSEPLEDIPNIDYSDFEDLAAKTRALYIDITITADRELIQAGIADTFKNNRLNIIAVNQKWFNLESQKLASKKLMDYYSINNPQILKAPLAFPVVLKNNKTTIIADSMQDLIEKKEVIEEGTPFLEEYLNGPVEKFLFLWDGINLISFVNDSFTEVQEDRFELLKTKLNFMLADEKADFTGFFTIKLIWSKNDWYVLDFIMRIEEKSALTQIKTDFLYLLNSAIYQKLYEIR